MAKKNNPFAKAKVRQGQPEPKKPSSSKIFEIERKVPGQATKELKRSFTRLKLQAVPFLRTLNAGFFARLAFFGAVCVTMHRRLEQTKEGRIVVPDEPMDSPTRYSKTFGQEKRLDAVLTQLNLEQDQEKEKVETDVASQAIKLV